MKTRTGFICLTLLLVCLSLACVSASDNVTSDALANNPNSSLNPENIKINHYYTPEKVVDNELVTVVVNVTNEGQIAYHNLTLYYNLPQGIEPLIWPSEYVNGTWTIDSLYPGKYYSLMIVGMITVSNTTLTTTLSDDNETLSTLDIRVFPSADLAIKEERIVVDGLWHWFIRVDNYGPDDGLNTTVYYLPDYLAYETAVGEVLGSQWFIGTLKSGEYASLMLVCEPLEKYSFNILVLSDIFDPNMANNNVSGSSPDDPGNNTPVKVVDRNSTGNPIALLLFALFMIPLTKFRRDRK